jgi:tyrosyl-tRNA synthetase
MTTSSGVKMGKSIGGAVWLNDDMLSSYEYFQYWRNVEDKDVIRFAKLYADMDESEMNALINTADTNINEAKKILAYTLTKLCHGQDSADRSIETSTKIFEQGMIDHNLTTVEISSELLASSPLPAFELFFLAGLSASKGDARRLIRGNGAKINDEIIEEYTTISLDTFNKHDNIIKLSAGKKKHVLVKLAKSATQIN